MPRTRSWPTHENPYEPLGEARSCAGSSSAHACLDAALDRLSVGTVGRYPADTVAVAGTRYARVVLREDLSINGVLPAGAPFALSTWAGRTGLSELPALAAPTDWRVWARRVRLDLRALRPYVRAVYAATDTYLAALPDEALDPRRDELRPCVFSALLLALGQGRARCPAWWPWRLPLRIGKLIRLGTGSRKERTCHLISTAGQGVC